MAVCGAPVAHQGNMGMQLSGSLAHFGHWEPRHPKPVVTFEMFGHHAFMHGHISSSVVPSLFFFFQNKQGFLLGLWRTGDLFANRKCGTLAKLPVEEYKL